MALLAAAAPELGATFGEGGISLWQTMGALLAVFGLLVVCLKLLGRFQRRQSHRQAQILTVWPLGPRREIQVVRLDEEVHYIYRHEGAMVVLKKAPLAAWEAESSALNRPQERAGGLLGRLFSRTALKPTHRACDLEA